MARVEAKLEEMKIVLPGPVKAPPGAHVPFAWVRVRGDRAYASGHAALNEDGSPAGPFGKVGAEVSPEEACVAARGTGIAILSTLKRELGDLDRVSAWLMVTGLINAASDFGGHTNVINGFSELILDLYGPEAGLHARAAPGVASLPFGLSVMAEVEIDG